MEASTVRGGQQQYEKALELHQAEEARLFASKSIYLGHNSRVEHMEAPTTLPGGRHKKRALELYHLLPQEEDDDDDDDAYWEEKEATFVAGADGAYTNFEMPKRIHRGYDVGVRSARIRALHAEEERDVALRHRHRSEATAMMRDMYAKAMAKAAAAPHT